jgi:predicted nucleic acid-binding protein
VILVDTSVLLDILQDDPVWSAWSIAALRIGRAQDNLAINDVVFAELSARYDHLGEVEEALDTLELPLQAIPKQALFLSGKAFQRYRSRGGSKNSVLADFFIGAHALVEGARLLTRDVRTVRSYFPDVTLIAP